MNYMNHVYNTLIFLFVILELDSSVYIHYTKNSGQEIVKTFFF